MPNIEHLGSVLDALVSDFDDCVRDIERRIGAVNRSMSGSGAIPFFQKKPRGWKHLNVHRGESQMSMPKAPKASPVEPCGDSHYAYALMVGSIATGCEFVGPFATEDHAVQAWDEYNGRGKPAAIVPLFFYGDRQGKGFVNVDLHELGFQIDGIYRTEELAQEWYPDIVEPGTFIGSARITPPRSNRARLRPVRTSAGLGDRPRSEG